MNRMKKGLSDRDHSNSVETDKNWLRGKKEALKQSLVVCGISQPERQTILLLKPYLWNQKGNGSWPKGDRNVSLQMHQLRPRGNKKASGLKKMSECGISQPNRVHFARASSEFWPRLLEVKPIVGVMKRSYCGCHSS